uniref:Uncharacterized protein n=1 Tax=Anguilla anguilla TaxID=7936 RepID=A0A0E9XRT5_ANGAN
MIRGSEFLCQILQDCNALCENEFFISHYRDLPQNTDLPKLFSIMLACSQVDFLEFKRNVIFLGKHKDGATWLRV